MEEVVGLLQHLVPSAAPILLLLAVVYSSWPSIDQLL